MKNVLAALGLGLAVLVGGLVGTGSGQAQVTIRSTSAPIVSPKLAPTGANVAGLSAKNEPQGRSSGTESIPVEPLPGGTVPSGLSDGGIQIMTGSTAPAPANG
jgi:hypothetical protein